MRRSLLAQKLKQIGPKAFRSPVCRLRRVPDFQVHLLCKPAVEKVEWAFIMILAHISTVRRKSPVNSFSAKFDLGIIFKKAVDGPLLEYWPVFDTFSQDERLFRPSLGKLIIGQVLEAPYLVPFRDPLGIGPQADIGTGKGAMDYVG